MQDAESFAHANFEIGFETVPTPYTDEGFADLGSDYLLAEGRVCEARHNASVISIFMRYCCGFGIEHENFFIFVGSDEGEFLGWKDHEPSTL